MPAKPFDIKEYIKSLKLSEEEEKALTPILEKPERVEEIKRGWNSQSESSRLVDEANTVKTAAATEKAEADRIKAEATTELEKNRGWATALQKWEADAKAAMATNTALTEEKTAYEAYLRSIGVEPEFALEGKKPITPPAPRQEPPVPDPNKPATVDPKQFESYLKKEDYYKEVTPTVKLLADLPFELTRLNFKHMALYGKPVADADLEVIQKTFLSPQNQRSLSDIAAENLHFAERETAMAEESLTKRAETMANEMYTKRMSELNLPGAAIDQIQPDMSSVVRFSSKEFSENAGRAGQAQAGTISPEEMQQFLEIDRELASQNIRP